MEVPKVPDSSTFRFRARLRTRWSDEDNQQVVNNAVYMTLLEEARFRYFTELDGLRENHFPFVLAQTNVVFLLPGRGGVEVDVLARTTHLGTTSFTQVYRIVEVANGATWCEAEARLVAWDAARRAKQDLPAELRTAVARFEGLSTS